MLPVILSILVGIGSNLDNFTFQSARSQRWHRVPWVFCFAVAIISSLSVIAGGMTALRLSSMMPASARYVVGSLILMCIGSWSLAQTWLPTASAMSSDHQLEQRWLPRGDLRFGLNEMMFIGLANTLTTLTAGFGVGFANLSLTMSALSVGLFSFLFLTVPVWFGVRPRPRKWGQRVILVCSALLIISALQW